MECNRDEAVRAREMAEQKLALQDYAAAKKFALKAQQLFPALENIAQVIAVIDVHVAAQVRIGADEKDWYGILQIEPTADDAVVKKQYRKLALFLHPDKNKSIGAESAFKLIGEALQVLSDKVKRLVYDTKRGTHARANHASARNPHGPGVNGRYGHQQYPDGAAHSDAFNKASQQHFPQPPQAAPQLHPFTFWTACSSCQMRYQYFRKYENQNLLCPQCRRPFIAKDLSNLQRVNVTQAWPPQAGQSNPAGPQPGQSNPAGLQTGQSNPHLSANFGADGLRFFNSFASGGRPDSCHNLFGAGNQFNAATSAKNGADCTTKRVRENVEAEIELSRKIEELRRARVMEKELAKLKEQMKKSKAIEKAQEALAKSMMKKEQAEKASVKVKKKRGKKHKNSSSSESEETDEYSERVTGEGGRDSLKVYPRRSSRSKRNVTYNSNETDDDFQEVPSGKKVRVETEVDSPKQAPKGVDMAKKLADLAKNAIRMKLNLQTGRPAGVTASALDEAQEKNRNAPGLVKRPELPEGKTEQLVSHGSEDGVLANCTVPDADFHNFDEGREEKDVEVGQIWALYDDKDGMPKYYMKVKEVHSYTPFKVLIGWFEMRKPSEEVCKLLDLGFSFTCGEFRISASQVMDSVNSFSHLVTWEKGGKGIVKIYPKKGEIWCIYKDWEPRQQVVKSDAPLKYSMVEILTDCNENSGATVMLLNKVEGFKTAFQLVNEQVLQVPFLELLRFSHQVPAHKLKCDEAPGIPENCWELDPAAVPLSLIYPDLNSVKVGTD